MLDPAYLASLAALPRLGSPRLLDQQRNGDRVTQRVRYEFVGELSSSVRKVVDPRRLTWVEASEVVLADRRTVFAIEPDHYEALLVASGEISVAADGDGGSTRLAVGEVKVRVPLVSGKVERAIVSGLQDHAAAEEAALSAWLANR